MRATSLRFLWPLLCTWISFAACAHHPRNPDAKTVGLSDREYTKLTTKAHAGDRNAAETLARLWYVNSEDNSKALYWLEVAAQNGSKRAEQYSQMAKKYLAD